MLTKYYELLMLSYVSFVVEYNEFISQGTINLTSSARPKCNVMNIIRVTFTTIQHVWRTEQWPSFCMENINVKLLICEMLTSC